MCAAAAACSPASLLTTTQRGTLSGTQYSALSTSAHSLNTPGVVLGASCSSCQWLWVATACCWRKKRPTLPVGSTCRQVAVGGWGQQGQTEEVGVERCVGGNVLSQAPAARLRKGPMEKTHKANLFLRVCAAKQWSRTKQGLIS